MNSDAIILRQNDYPPLINKGAFLTSDDFDDNFINVYKDLDSLAFTNGVDAYNALTTYDDAAVQFATYGGRTWQWINAAPGVGVTPVDGIYWVEIFPTLLGHRKNSDTILAEGTSDQSTAAEIRAFIDAGLTSTTNLSISTKTTTTFLLESSTGADVTIPAATQSLAGLLTSPDKIKLDNLSGVNTGDQSIDSLGAEDVNRKATSFAILNDELYPSVQAVFTLSATKEDVANKQDSLAVDGTGVKYPTVDAVNSGLATNIKIFESHKFIEEPTARTANTAWAYTGSVLTCGATGTYATISAAYAAASSGDIIQLEDQVFDTAAEPGGYLLMNSATKRILIRGNASDNTACVIQQSSVASFCLRIRVSNEIQFQDLTVTSDQNNTTLYIDQSTGGAIFSFINCKILNTNVNGVDTIFGVGAPNAASLWEFRDCDLSANSNAGSFVIRTSGRTDALALTYSMPILFINCNINGFTNLVESVLFIAYDTSFNSTLDNPVLSFGSDTGAPTYLEAIIDVRSCSIEHTGAFSPHSVLLGRGVNNMQFINNKIYSTPSSDTSDIGMVIKCRAAILGDVLISGNYSEAPRPIYVKGGTRCQIFNNTCVSNWLDGTNGYGFELNNPDNPDGPISSIDNEVIGNNFVANLSAIGLSTSGTAETAISSLKQCTFRNNKYQINTGEDYVNDPVTLWGYRRDLWKQDVNSILYEV